MVEKKTGVLAVLSTPLLELPIQRILTKANNWSRNDDWANRPTMHDISIMKRCITIGYTTHRTRSRQFTDPLQDKTSYKADSVTSCYAVAAALQNGTTGQRYAVGGVPYNISTAQNTEGNKALFPLLWFQNPRCLRQNSDLRHTSSGQRSQSGKAALSR